MQEEVENRTVNLVVSATKLTLREVMKGVQSYLEYCKSVQKKIAEERKSPVRGKQTVKQLIGQNQGVANIDIEKTELKGFEKIARKYGIDYAVTKDKSTDPPRFLVFFKAKDTDALNAAYKEYVTLAMKKQTQKRPSVLKTLKRFKALIKAMPQKEKHKEHQRGGR